MVIIIAIRGQGGGKCYDFITHYYFIDFLSLRVTLVDAMRSMDIPRDPGSLTRTFSFISHVPGSCTCMSPIPFSHDLLLYRFGLTTRLCLRLSLMLTPFVSSTRLPPRYFWTVTHDMTRLPSYGLFVLVSRYLAVHYIYGWRWGFVPHLQSTLQPP